MKKVTPPNPDLACLATFSVITPFCIPQIGSKGTTVTNISAALAAFKSLRGDRS